MIDHRDSSATGSSGVAMLKEWIGDKRLSSIVLDQTSDSVLVTDADIHSPEGCKILFANEAICRLTGYERHELIGQTPRILQGEETDRTVLRRMKAALLAGGAATEEVLNYTKDGTPHWIEMQISPLMDETGEIVCYVSVQRDITGRKQTEIERERTEVLTAVGERTGSLGTWGYDLADDRVYWSPGLYRVFERKEALGPPTNEYVLGFIAAEHRPRMIEAMRAAIKHQHSFEIELRCRTERGKEIWIVMRGEALTERNGRTRAVVGATRDITAERRTRMRLEEAVDTNAELSRDFASARSIAKIGVFDYWVEEDLQHWSDELLAMTGLTRDMFPAPSDQFVSRVDPRDRPEFDRLFQRAKETGEGYQIQVLFHRPDGSEMHMQIVADVRDVEDKRRIVGIARDVSEEVAASELLRGQEERFRLIADTVSDVLWDFSIDDGTWWSTSAWPEKLGLKLDAEGVSPDQWIRFITEDDRVRYVASLVAALRSGADVWTDETTVTGSDGKSVAIQVNAKLLRRENGRVYRALGNMRNIEREKELSELLAQARGLESLSKMTGGIAHDFNNLLMIVLGNTELLEMADLAEEDREGVRLIARAAESASELTKRLLQFSGASRLTETVIDLREWLEDLLPLLKSSLTISIAIELDLAEDLWPLEIDSPALEQSILNLAINARDAMPNGGTLRISCENSTVSDQMLGRQTDLMPGSYVCISVCDDGEGMDQEVLAHAREPFFTTKDVGKGTGLGLSSVYGFARQSGGAIQIYSEPGLGTTIKLYLPASIDAAIAEPVARPIAPRHCGAGRSILLVDDEPEIRLHLENVLTRVGYRVTSAENAATALERLEERLGKEGAFDLLLTDIVMPGGFNGVDLARRVSAIAPAMRVLFTSGFAGAAFKDQLPDDTPEHIVLQKPYRSAELFKALDEVFAEA
ncbi:MAG: PAS domain S-box protein [Erythrobacter sp.]|nr:PAS domain S-box protein [Erythrobacter sp.]